MAVISVILKDWRREPIGVYAASFGAGQGFQMPGNEGILKDY
jgi:hypothetical protein